MLVTPKGNLLQNPGFELGLRFWETPRTLTDLSSSNVSAHSEHPHSGLSALALNELCPGHLSVVYQDVRVSPCKCYQLDFVASGMVTDTVTGPVRLSADVRWLDEEGGDLGLGLALFIHEVGRACDGEWSLYTGLTDEAPLAARQARISLASAGGCMVLVDDVAFFKVE